MNKNVRVKKDMLLLFLVFTFIGIIEWLCGLALTKDVNSLDYNIVTKMYEWGMIITLVVVLFVWKRKGQSLLTPFTIVLAFFVLFNMGQFIMWGFNIHYITDTSSELGVATHIRYMDKVTLMKIMFVTLPALTFFSSGAFLASGLYNEKKEKIDKENNEVFLTNLKKIVVPLLIITYAVTIYNTLQNVFIASRYGYTALYYGEDIQSTNAILKYISYMFFPSVFAYFIANKCSKRAFIRLSILIFPYILLNLLIGDRGSWIYFICLWAWCYLNFYRDSDDIETKNDKRHKKQRFIKLLLIGIVLLCFTMIFYQFRETGFKNITNNEIKEVAKDMQYIFIKPIFEMGQSARCLGIVIQDKLNESWTGGNTYIASILAMVLPRVKLFFGFYDGYIDNIFSQSYLNLKNYGVGFTAIAEAYLNGGELYYPVYIFIFGFFIGIITKYKNFKDGEINYKALFISLSSAVTIITACRGAMELSLRKWFYGCVVILILNKIMSLDKRTYNVKNKTDKENVLK